MASQVQTNPVNNQEFAVGQDSAAGAWHDPRLQDTKAQQSQAIADAQAARGLRDALAPYGPSFDQASTLDVTDRLPLPDTLYSSGVKTPDASRFAANARPTEYVDPKNQANPNRATPATDTGNPVTTPSSGGTTPTSSGGGGTPASPGGGATPASDPVQDLINALNDRMNPANPATGTGAGNPDYDNLVAALSERMNQPGQTPEEIAAQRQALLDSLVGDYEKAQIDRINYYDPQRLIDLLDQRIAAATQQANQQVDYATKRSAEDLNRTLQDAQGQFQTQMNAISADEMNALDNSALYAEMRGDRGGIGQAQYNSIQNTAAQNRLSVQQAQTKLTTDTSRQIADLRAQGEFQKADALLSLTQQYLSELSNIEQYAASHNLTVDQTNTAIAEWEHEFNAKRSEYIAGLDLSLAELTGRFSDGTQTYAAQQQTEQALANMTMSLLQSGVSPDQLSDDQLAALGAQYGMNPTAVAAFAQQIADDNAKTQNAQLASTAMDLIEAGISPDQLSDSQLKALADVYGMDPKTLVQMANNAPSAQEKNAAELAMSMLQAGMAPKNLSSSQKKALEKVYGADADTLATYAGLVSAANKKSGGGGSGSSNNSQTNLGNLGDGAIPDPNAEKGSGDATNIFDEMLRLGTHGVNPIEKGGYLDKELSGGSITPEEYEALKYQYFSYGSEYGDWN